MKKTIKVGKGGLMGMDFAKEICGDISCKSQSSGSVSRLRKIEESLPIGYTVIDTETLRKASDLIALEFGRNVQTPKQDK